MQYIIHLTNRCNLDCVYCFEKKRMREKRYVCSAGMMKIFYKSILQYQRARKDRNILIEFTGGEAFTIPYRTWKVYLDLQKEVFPKRYCVKNIVQTNLYHLTDKMIKLIKDYKISAGVSYDFTTETRVTKGGNDSSSKVFKNMLRLRKNGIRFSMICVVTKYNVDYMTEIYDFMVENGIDFHFLPCHRAAYAYQKRYVVDAKRYAHNLYKVIEKYILDTETSIRFNDAISYSSLILKNVKRDMLCSYSRRCAETFVTLKPNGDVYPCPCIAYKDYKLGNILEDNLVHILRSSNPVKQMLAKRFDEALSFNQCCRACNWNTLCNQGCPQEAVTKDDLYKRSKIFCTINKIVFSRLVKLYQRLECPTKIEL